MKNEYVAPEAEILYLSVTDIIRTSGDFDIMPEDDELQIG